MMKYKFTVLMLLLIGFTACNQSNTKEETLSDTATTNAVQLEQGTKLLARMQADKLIRGRDSVMLTFSVYNPADSAQQFCKWHTPFEPLMSKYLEVKDQKGRAPDYKGPMAKRIMPPPADSYIKVAPKETLSTKVDLLLGYDLKTGNTYTVIYAAEGISGLVVRDTVSFLYKK